MTTRKRFFTRHPIVVGVKVRVADGWQRMVTVDVSRRGLFLRTESPIALGRIAQMEIELPSGKTLEAMGHVRRSVTEEDGSGIGPGMGIEFFVMAKDAQDAWDQFVIEQKRRGAARLEESDELPIRPGGVPSDLPNELIRLSGLPPDMNTGSSEPFFEDDDEPEVAPTPELPADALEELEALEELRDSGPELPKRPPSVFAGRATQQVAPLEESAPVPASTSSQLEPADASDELQALIEAARDSAAETEAAKIAYITVQPSDHTRLSEFVDRKLRGSNVFLRTGVRCHEGQIVDITIVHPDTDSEFVIQGRIKKVLGGTTTPGALVRFERPDADERNALQRWVVTGEPDDDDDAPAEVADFAAIAAAATANPVDIGAQLDLAWGELRINEAPQAAIAAFLQALTLDSGNAQVHHGLAVAYALAGDTIKAYAFVRSACALSAGAAAR